MFFKKGIDKMLVEKGKKKNSKKKKTVKKKLTLKD